MILPQMKRRSSARGLFSNGKESKLSEFIFNFELPNAGELME